MPVVLIIVLCCLVLALAMALALFAAGLQRRSLERRLQRHLNGPSRARVHEVIVFDSEALDGKKPLGQLGQPGFLLIDHSEVRIVAMGRGVKGEIREGRVERDTAAMGWFPVHPLTLSMTSLIRLRSEIGVFYLAARNRLGTPSSQGTMRLKELLSRHFRCKPSDTAPEHLLALVLKLGLILLFAAATNAGIFAYRSSDLLGPEIVVAGQGGVAVASKQELTLMDSDGAILNRLALTDLGIAGRLTDLRWAPGNVLYLGDVEAGTIVRCELEPVDCAPLPGLAEPDPGLLGAFSFALDLPRERIYLADTGNHRLLMLDLNGSLLGEFQSEPRKLCFPNSVRLAEDGSHLYLSDSNNFRLRGFSLNSGEPVLMPEFAHNYFVSTLPEDYGCRHDRKLKFHEKWLDRASDFHLRGRPSSMRVVAPELVWGFDTLRDGEGRWWMILGDGNLRRGAVVRMQHNWMKPEPVELPEGSDPASLTLLGEHLLVADPLRPAIYRVDIRSLEVHEFGSEAYRAGLGAIARGQQRAGLIYQVSLIAAVALLMLVLALAISNQRAQLRRIKSAE